MNAGAETVICPRGRSSDQPSLRRNRLFRLVKSHKAIMRAHRPLWASLMLAMPSGVLAPHMTRRVARSAANRASAQVLACSRQLTSRFRAHTSAPKSDFSFSRFGIIDREASGIRHLKLKSVMTLRDSSMAVSFPPPLSILQQIYRLDRGKKLLLF